MAVAKKGEMYGLVKSYLVKSSLFACPVFIMIYLYAPWLFETVFGGEWTMAGKLASVMAPWLFMNFLTSPLSTMFVVLNKQEVVIGISLVYMLVPAGSVYFYRNLELVEVMHSVTFMMVGVLAVFLITAVVYSLKFDRGRV
jgi:O-antigen/teichoic acid export membrane protein